MSSRAILALLMMGLVAPVSAPSATELADAPPIVLPLEWFAGSPPSSNDLWQVGAMGPTTYSYLRSRRPALLLDALPTRQATLAGPRTGGAEQTYTVVERFRRARPGQPLANAAFLLASAVCGIGGVAWWRCSGRGPS